MIGSGAGIIFKGSGFYCTDYRSDGYKSAAKTDTGNSGKPSDKENGNQAGNQVRDGPRDKT